MSYALSFSPEFFREISSSETRTCDPINRPTSVSQALANLSVETWSRLARDVFRCEPHHLDIEAVLAKIEETNTCLNLDSPVEVAIDANSDFTILVYDQDEP